MKKAKKMLPENLNIWITGASRGIGLEIAKALSKYNCKLILCATNQDSFSDNMEEIKKIDNAFLIPCDLRKPEEIFETHKRIKQMFGDVDALVNNAGKGIFAPLKDFPVEDFDLLTEVNFKGKFLCSKAVLPGMLEKKKGAIINVLSIAIERKFENSSIYSATKAAVKAMNASLREEVRKYGVSIVDVLPGATETDIWPDNVRKELASKMMKPADVAAAVEKVILLTFRDSLMVEEIKICPQGGDL